MGNYARTSLRVSIATRITSINAVSNSFKGEGILLCVVHFLLVRLAIPVVLLRPHQGNGWPIHLLATTPRRSYPNKPSKGPAFEFEITLEGLRALSARTRLAIMPTDLGRTSRKCEEAVAISELLPRHPETLTHADFCGEKRSMALCRSVLMIFESSKKGTYVESVWVCSETVLMVLRALISIF